MTEVIPLDEFERKAPREHARVVESLHGFADRIETMSESSVREVLPIAADALDELMRHLAPRLR